VTPEGGQHPTPEILRAFGQGKLDASHAARIEQHLLVCALCCDKLKDVPADSFIDLLRETQPDAKQRPAVTAQPATSATPPTRLVGGWSWWIMGILGIVALGIVVLIVLQRLG